MTIRTQQYALRAYDRLNAVANDEVANNEVTDEIANNEVTKKRDPSFKKKYRTVALTFPTMILQSGLAQAVGFLKAKTNDKDKDGDEHRQYLADLAFVLEIKDGDVLHTQVIKSTVTEYQYLTRKSLDASAWLRRYTQALLKDQNTTEQGGNHD